MEEALLLHVGLDQLHVLGRAARELEIAQGLLIDRENADGGAVLGGHVPDRRAIGQRQRRHTWAEELDELSHDPFGAKHLRNGQYEIGRRRALGEAPAQSESNDLRNEHRDGLAEHGGFGFDASDAPTHDAEPVDHRRMRIGPDQCIGICLGRTVRPSDRPTIRRKHHAREVLEVDLVYDPRVGRHDLEAREGFLRPAQQRVALTVALELEVRIDLEGAGRAELVHDHRVVDHELGGEQRIHALRVAAHLHHRVTHGGEIHDRGDAREVLQQDARRHECNFFVRHLPGVPARQVLEIFGPDDAPIFAAQQVFEQDLQRVGEFGDGQSTALERVEAVDLVRPPARLQRGAAPETVSTHCGSTFTATTKYSVSPKQVVGTPLCC